MSPPQIELDTHGFVMVKDFSKINIFLCIRKERIAIESRRL
jgi:hypothetical protein